MWEKSSWIFRCFWTMWRFLWVSNSLWIAFVMLEFLHEYPMLSRNLLVGLEGQRQFIQRSWRRCFGIQGRKKLLGRALMDSIDLCPGTWPHSDQRFYCVHPHPVVDSYESMEDFSGFPFFHGIYEGFADGGFISSWLEPTSSSHLQVIQGRLADVLKATGGTAWWRMDLYIPK